MGQREQEPGTGLGAQIVRGGAWLAALQVALQSVALLRIVIVARILAPSDLGLLGMALLTIAVFRIFSETGFDKALIQQREVSERALHTAWTALALRGIVLTALLYPGAAALVWFFDQPSAVPLLRVLSLAVLIEGFSSLSLMLVQKQMDFRRLFLHRVSGLLADFAVTITLLLITRSVWALVFGMLASALVRLVVSYSIHPYRPRVMLDGGELRNLLGYGKWVAMSGILVFLLLQGDDLFVGKVFGAVLLGYYQVAYRISNLPATAISEVIGRVLFPAYSKVQEDLVRLGRLFVRSLTLTALLVFPVSALIGGLAEVFTRVLLGDRWMPIVPLVQALAAFGLLRSLGATTGPVFLSVGRPEIRTRIQAGQLLMLAAVIYPLARTLGVVGVGLAVTSYALVFNLYAVLRALRHCGLGIGRTRSALLWPAIAGGATFGALLAAARSGVVEPSLLGLIGLACAGTILYAALIALFDRIERGAYIDALRRLRAVLFEGAAPSS